MIRIVYTQIECATRSGQISLESLLKLAFVLEYG